MSYTIPDSVQTKAEAVLAVASAIADEDMGARYDGTVNTLLDVLADVLAAQDVQVPQTNAGAILALAQYAHGGGGGGGTSTITFYDNTQEPPVEMESVVYPAVWSAEENCFVPDKTAGTVSEFVHGSIYAVDTTEYSVGDVTPSLESTVLLPIYGNDFVMPSMDMVMRILPV